MQNLRRILCIESMRARAFASAVYSSTEQKISVEEALRAYTVGTSVCPWRGLADLPGVLKRGNSTLPRTFVLRYVFKMDRWFGSAALGLALLATSCASYKVPTTSFAQTRSGENAAHYNAVEQRALEHPLYLAIPRHRSQVRWYDMPHWMHWGLLGNDDDGIFGEGQRVPYSTNINAGTFVRWSTRNSLHNFCFYVVGSAQWRRHYHAVLFSIADGRVRAFSRGEKGVFDSDNSFKIAFNDFKPFIAFQFAHFKNRRFQFYVGWRDRGNLGFKLRPWAKGRSREKQPKSKTGGSTEPQGPRLSPEQPKPDAAPNR